MIEKVEKFLKWAQLILSGYMVLTGLNTYIATSGLVQGSEFGMLITLANELSLVIIWLALYALRKNFECMKK